MVYQAKSGCLSPSSARLFCRKVNHSNIPCPRANTASLTVWNPTAWYHPIRKITTGCPSFRYLRNKSHGAESLGTQKTADSMKAAVWSFSPVRLWVCKGLRTCLYIPITRGIVVKNGRRMKEWSPWKRAIASRSCQGQFGWSKGQKVSDTASVITGPREKRRKLM